MTIKQWVRDDILAETAAAKKTDTKTKSADKLKPKKEGEK
jgi:hypothetical protein